MALEPSYESHQGFFEERVAEACAECVNEYFRCGAKIRTVETSAPGLLAYEITLPNSLAGDERIVVETFVVAWGRGMEFGIERTMRRRA